MSFDYGLPVPVLQQVIDGQHFTELIAYKKRESEAMQPTTGGKGRPTQRPARVPSREQQMAMLKASAARANATAARKRS